MAILVAVAGAAIGSATGIGGSLGWTIGSMIGSLLFPQKGQNSVGPRLGDLTVQSSAFGASIGIGYGVVRVAGNIIWATKIKETKHVKKAKFGKGGGGGSSQTTFTYSASFAIGMVEGEADAVLRMWADGKLIYDKKDTNVNTKKKKLKFRFYPGSETQIPDTLIQGDAGEDRTPAFRGLCYIVFEDMQLADYGNRIPNITAEIAFRTVHSRPVVPGNPKTAAEGGISDIATSIAIDWDRNKAYTAATGYGLRVFETNTMVEVRQKADADIFVNYPGDQVNNPVCVAPDGTIICNGNGGNNSPVYRIDPNTLIATHVFGDTSGVFPEWSSTQFTTLNTMGFLSLYSASGTECYAIVTGAFGCIGILNCADMAYVWDNITAVNDMGGDTGIGGSRAHSIIQGSVEEGKGTAFVITGAHPFADTEPLKIWKITMLAGAHYDSDVGASSGVTVELQATFEPGDLIPGETDFSAAGGGVYDQTDDSIIFAYDADSTGDHWMFKVRDGEIIWRSNKIIDDVRVDTPVAAGTQPFGAMSNSRITGNTLGWVTQGYPYMLDTITGEIIYNGDSPIYSTTNGIGYTGAYDSETESFIGIANGGVVMARWFFRRVTPEEANVADIVEDISIRTGMSATDLDLSDISDLTIPGYLIGRQVQARAAIEPLASAYFFNGTESDYLLKFVKLGGSSVRTLTEDDLTSSGRQEGVPISESRTQEIELPERVNVAYISKENDYQQGAASTKRVSDPVPTMYSHNQLNFQITGVLTATFSKQVAEKMLYTSWIERSSYTLKTSWEHIDLDPTDVITIELNDGTTFVPRITQFDIGTDFGLQITGISQKGARYVSTTEGDPGSVPDQVITSDTITKLLLLDSPLLRDSDEPAGRVTSPIYYFMGSYGDANWNNAYLYKSATVTNFQEAGQSGSPMDWGTAITALPDPPFDNPFVTDHTSTLTVQMYGSSALESVTFLEMLNGANAAALIKENGEIEVIQFKDAVQNGDGTFTISTILRGRRGTDTMAYDHTSFETFLLLIADDGEALPLTLSELNVAEYYKASAPGQLLEDAEVVGLTSVGRALMPYAPVQQSAALAAADALDIAWVRRTRVGGAFSSGTGEVPMSEDSEEYELEIYDAPGGAVVRTVTGLTSPDYTYSAADQTSDGFAPPMTEITMKVYQISAQVGRGFSREVTVSVT